MAVPTYATGTVSVSDGGTVVTGSGAIWSGINVVPGDMIAIDGMASVLVLDVADVTHLTIPAWAGGDKAAVAYVIYQCSSQRFSDVQIALDLKNQVQALNTEGFYVFVASSASAPDPSLGDDGQYAFQAATGKLWVKDSGLWSYLGIYKGFGFKDAWDSATAYTVNDVVTLGGSSYIAVAGNTNKVPPNATYWTVLAKKGDKGDKGDGGAAPLQPIVLWATATAYVVGPPASFVSQGGSSYQCLVAHTSGAFSTDLAAGKWGLVAQKGQDGSGTGDMQAANFASEYAGHGIAVRSNLGFSAVGEALAVAADDAAARAAIGAAPDAQPGKLLRRTVYTNGATWTKQSDVGSILVEAGGAGGAGAGATSTSGAVGAGAGGGGGGYSSKLIAAASLGATEAVTVGTGGAGSTGANGASGGTSSFGAHCSATGGGGGTASPGAGGSGSGGTLNLKGASGSAGVGAYSVGLMLSGFGGDAARGGAGGAGTNGNVAGGAGDLGGGGGGGATFNGAASTAGGAGGNGYVIVWEYSK